MFCLIYTSINYCARAVRLRRNSAEISVTIDMGWMRTVCGTRSDRGQIRKVVDKAKTRPGLCKEYCVWARTQKVCKTCKRIITNQESRYSYHAGGILAAYQQPVNLVLSSLQLGRDMQKTGGVEQSSLQRVARLLILCLFCGEHLF